MKKRFSEEEFEDARLLARLMPFGQYAGQSIESLIDKDPGYVAWVAKNVDEVEIPKKWENICRVLSQ